MPAKTKSDWASQAVITVVESAANTLTYKKLETGFSLADKVAWLISRIEYFHHIFAVSEFNGDSDSLTLALTVANTMTSLSLTDQAVIDMIAVNRADFGTAATAIKDVRPIVKDLSNLPGGGLLVPPNPLYGAALGSGLVGASTNFLKLFYTVVELATDDYWALVESRRMISS